MELTAAIQEALLVMLCYDASPRGARLVRTLIRPTEFDAYYREIAEAAEKHLDKYGKPPSEHTLDLVESLKSRHKSAADIYDNIFNSMQGTKEGLQPEWVLDEAQTFATQQRLKYGTMKVLEHLERGGKQDIAQALAAMDEARKSSFELFSPGLLLNDPKQALRFLDSSIADVLPVGIKELDRLGFGPARKRLHVLVGLRGKGKSWWLIHLAKQALMHRNKVVYISLELSEDEIAQRLVQSIFSVSKRSEAIKRMRFKCNELGHFIDLKPMDLKPRKALTSPSIERYLRKRVELLQTKPRIYIKQFPSGQVSMRDVEAYLDGLQGAQSFIPDLILVDYPDLMKHDPKHKREELNKIYTDLRGLAIQRNTRVAVVSQGNRPGETAKTLQMHHLAEDISKGDIADVLMTYNRTDAEKRLGLARLYIAKGRTDVDGFTLLLAQAFAIGQFCLDSARMVRAAPYWERLEPDEKPKDDEE
jgi:replicative DNA helicase